MKLPKLHPALLKTPALHGLRNSREPKQIKRLGEPVAHDIVHNCLTCSRWPSCLDSKKSGHFRCSRYREATIESTDIESLMRHMDGLPELSPEKVEESEFNNVDTEDALIELIEKVLNSNIPIPPDLKIDDRDIPEAKNLMEWTTSSKFAGVGVPPFPRQIEIGTKLFSEYCPKCSDAEWFDEMPHDTPIPEMLDRVVFLEHGKCPQCNRTRNQLVHKGWLLDPFSLIGVAGQRSAKTTSVVLWDSYNDHRILKTPNPAGVYGLLSSQTLMTSFTAMTFGQAVENIWVPFRAILTEYPWYKTYHNFLESEAHRLGEELHVISEQFARYRHRNFFISPASPSKRTMRGRTRVGAVADEIGWFPLARAGDKKGKGQDFERLDARGVRDALVNSLFTVKNAYRRRLEEGYNVPKPVFYAVSSPQSVNDAIMTFYREAQGSKEIYSFLYETWNFNPLIKRSDLDEYFRNDAIAANRDFGCVPPIGEGLFLNDTKALEKCFTKKINPMHVKSFIGLSKTGQRITTSSVKMLSNKPPSHPTVLCVDVGLVNNSFAFSVVGIDDDYVYQDPEDTGTHLNPVKVFAVGEVIPQPGTRISITHLYNGCLKPICDFFNVSYFVSDRWNNVKIAQDLENEYEITPLEYQCKWVDFDNTRELLYTGNLTLPKLDSTREELMETVLDDYPENFRRRPTDHLFYQMATVREHTNVTVTKGDGVTDDLFRTIVLGVAMLQDDEIFEFIETNANEMAEERTAIGISQGYSAGGSNTASGKSITNGNGVTVAGLFKYGR